MLGNRALDNRINKIKALEAQKKELEAQIAALKTEIRKDMKQRGTEVYATTNFVIHFKEVISNNFDSTRFKKDHIEMYKAYCNPSTSIRLTIH